MMNDLQLNSKDRQMMRSGSLETIHIDQHQNYNHNNQRITLQTTNPNRTGTKLASLEWLSSYDGKMECILSEFETSIGRKDDNTIILTCAKISKKHASIFRELAQYTLRDNNSSNGVKVNDIPISPNELKQLKHLDQIIIGSVCMVFYNDDIGEQQKQSIKKNYDDKTLSSSDYIKLVTILPSEEKYEESLTIRAEIEAETEEVDFTKVNDITDIELLKVDYEKLRMAYELSKLSLTNDITQLLAKSLDLVFELMPVDRGVVLLLDQASGTFIYELFDSHLSFINSHY